MAADPALEYLESARFHFRLYKRMGEGALKQLRPDDLYWQAHPEVNSVQVIVQHLHGNMLSRWTDFLTTDGEKPNRERDAEFEGGERLSRDRIKALWEEGWDCLLSAVDALSPDDLTKDVQIRGQKLSVIDAVNRQMTHVAYHVGQLVQIGKERLGTEWKTLSIPRGASADFARQVASHPERYRGNSEE